MKNLPCIIFLSAIASLLLLAVACSLGAPIQYWFVASRIAAVSGSAGVLAIFLADYAPRRSYRVAGAVRTAESAPAIVPAARAVASRGRLVRSSERPFDITVVEGAMATLGLRNDPVTVSLI